MKVCLDAGHQTGVDSGAQGNGLHEEDLTLAIALETQRLLAPNGVEVVMTRTTSKLSPVPKTVNDSLRTRYTIANQAKADLFVSIHVNAGGGTGTEVYALPGGRAIVCAQHVINELIAACGWANRGIKSANFSVLVNTTMPAILTENGFVDTLSDANKLKDPNFIKAIALAHAKGICNYSGISFQAPEVLLPDVIDTYEEVEKALGEILNFTKKEKEKHDK